MKERYRNEDCAGFVEWVNWLYSWKPEGYEFDNIEKLQESVQITDKLNNARTVAIFKVKLKQPK